MGIDQFRFDIEITQDRDQQLTFLPGGHFIFGIGGSALHLLEQTVRIRRPVVLERIALLLFDSAAADGFLRLFGRFLRFLLRLRFRFFFRCQLVDIDTALFIVRICRFLRIGRFSRLFPSSGSRGIL